MVDDKVAEEVKAEPTEPEKVEEDKKEETIEKAQMLDTAAIDELKGKMEDIEKRSLDYESRMEKAKKAILGEDSSTKEEEDIFYKKLATMPKEAVEDLIKKNIEPIKQEFQKREILDKDKTAFMNLRASYPDFDEVMKDAPIYLSREDMEATESLPNRTEVRFNLIRGRREIGLRNKKMQETNSINKAKSEINKTAKTEVPAGGQVQETKTDNDARRERIEKYKGEWDSDKVLDEVMDGDYESILNDRLRKTYK